MAEIARRHGVVVDVTRLEDWAPIECDLLFAAQSWHWVDPDLGARTAAQAVRSEGRWAALWNYENDPVFATVRNSVYRRLAPNLIVETVTADDAGRRVPMTQALAATGAFDEIVIHDIDWIDEVTVESVVQRVATQSAHHLLDRDTASRVQNALRSELGEPDQVLELTYVTRVFTARRR